MFDGDAIDEPIVTAMEAQRWDEARALIQEALAAMPADWSPVSEDRHFVRCTFWNHSEFLDYASRHKAAAAKAVMWTWPSYSKLWWQLAVVNVAQGRLDNAAVCIDSGIALEPDHPLLWIERGYICNRMGRPADALDAYRTAAGARAWSPPSVVARALRGQGSALIDLGRLEEAHEAYTRSLKLDPKNEAACTELAYVDHALEEEKARAKTPPWFVHCVQFPPTDPLTIQLRALVEGLPPIPGPKTMGAENYAKILKAFLERGWAGFEEAFDEIVPRERSDYAEVKRDLLRETIFSAKMHSRLARLFADRATVEEIRDEMERDGAPAERQ